MSKASLVVSKESTIGFLEKIGYCNCNPKYLPNKLFCMNCGKPHKPEIKGSKKKGYKIICPYCDRLYAISSFKEHVKKQHSVAVLRHFKSF